MIRGIPARLGRRARGLQRAGASVLGFKTVITFHPNLRLKKWVADYEAYIKKLKELVDNDKAEELIDELSSNDERRIDLVEIKNQILKLKEDVSLSKEKWY